MAMCAVPCAYYKYRNILEQKVNVRSIPPTINPEPSMGIQTIFIEKETTDRSLLYLEPNNQTTFCQLCLKAMNMVSPSQCLLV